MAADPQQVRKRQKTDDNYAGDLMPQEKPRSVKELCRSIYMNEMEIEEDERQLSDFKVQLGRYKASVEWASNNIADLEEKMELRKRERKSLFKETIVFGHDVLKIDVHDVVANRFERAIGREQKKDNKEQEPKK